MALTRVDEAAALVVIDLQKGIVQYPTVHPIAEVVGRSARLAQAFRERGLPVVLVRAVPGSAARGRSDAGPRNWPAMPADWTELVPELEERSGDLVINKGSWGAFIGTSLDGELRARGVTQVFVTGVATSIGVESTARSAWDFGYNVVLVVDAMTDVQAESHRHSVEKIFPRLGETATTDEVVGRLTGDSLYSTL